MHIDTCHTKKYVRHLLRDSYRENGKVKHRTLANLSACSAQEIEAIKLALKHKHDLAALMVPSQEIELKQGLSVGAVYTIHQMLRQLGILQALGIGREAKLATWQIIARVIDQGSRLSAVRLATQHACCDVLGLDAFNEDDLYKNLNWISKNQKRIEDQMFSARLKNEEKPSLYLYDVTSTYLEGIHNALGAFGYNRDGKRGKLQIVIGLLCDNEGRPVSIELFEGNTQDTKTFRSQIEKVETRFGGGKITFVGDRGMIKQPQISALLDHGFNYITAITKPQIESLLKNNVLDISLFDDNLVEIQSKEIRYILRKNPIRAEEIKRSRESRIQKLISELEAKNSYLSQHPKANPAVALRKVIEKSTRLRVQNCIHIGLDQRVLTWKINERGLEEDAKLDGCYVIKTNLAKTELGTEKVHERYKDLSMVEWAFRISKTVDLELRPVYLRKASHTRGHAVVVMLAYRVMQALAEAWSPFDLTVAEGLNHLKTLVVTEIWINQKPVCSQIPTPMPLLEKLLAAVNVKMPKGLACRNENVVTRKKLQTERKVK